MGPEVLDDSPLEHGTINAGAGLLSALRRRRETVGRQGPTTSERRRCSARSTRREVQRSSDARSVRLAEPVAMLSSLKKLRLSFEPELEAEFRRYHCGATIRFVRLALVLGGLLVAGFGILDAYVAPSVKYQFWFIRFAVACPCFALCFIASYSRHFERYSQLLLSLTVLVGGLGIVAMIMIAPPPGDQTYYAGLMLVLMFAYARSCDSVSSGLRSRRRSSCWPTRWSPSASSSRRSST